MTTIVLVDDHPFVRQGLRVLLEAEPGLRIIGEAGDGLEAVQLVERLKPDALMLDLMIPGLSGLEVTRQVSQRSPRTRVVILSMHANEAYVLEALRNGATGYVLKDAGVAKVVKAIQEVAAGRCYLSPPLFGTPAGSTERGRSGPDRRTGSPSVAERLAQTGL